MKGTCAPPHVPLGREIRDIEVVNASPLDVGEVFGDEGIVVCDVKLLVHKLGDGIMLRCCRRSGRVSAMPKQSK